jgi:hypothetical protein
MAAAKYRASAHLPEVQKRALGRWAARAAQTTL